MREQIRNRRTKTFAPNIICHVVEQLEQRTLLSVSPVPAAIAQPSDTPSAPVGLTALAGSSGDLTLSWNPVPNATSYSIYRAAQAGAEGAAPIASDLPGTFFIDSGLQNDAPDFYTVVANNAAGSSVPSVEASATPEANPPATLLSVPVVGNESNLISPETDALPDPTDPAYTDVSWTQNPPDTSLFNGQANVPIRNLEIAGVAIDLKPGTSLFDQMAYTDPTGLSGQNRDIQTVSIYADTVTIEGHLWLPQTNVTIFARQLIFQDSSGVTASIETTPLSYLHGNQQFQNGKPGGNAGNITLHVQTVSIPPSPAAPAPARFILNGANGQDAGEGKAGDPGTDMNSFYWVEDAPRQSYPGTVYFVWNNTPYFGQQTWPGDGQPATAGGSPGNGGNGGQLIAEGATDLTPFTVAQGGAPGSSAQYQPGGSPGTPSQALWVARNNEKGEFDIYTILGSHDSQPGAGWNPPSGTSGASGSVQMVPASQTDANDWVHPAALRAMINYAKDAYLNGNIGFAKQAFGEYDQILTETAADSSSLAEQFQQMQPEVAQLDARAAAGLDYFGNPPGWVPVLGLAVNSQAYQKEIQDAIQTEYLAQIVETAGQSAVAAQNAIEATLTQLDRNVADAENQLTAADALLPQLQSELASIQSQTQAAQQSISEKQQELTAQAQSDVEARHEGSFWQEALGVLSIAATALTPVFGPVAGGVGAGLGLLSTLAAGQPVDWSSIGSVAGAFSSSNLTTAVSDYNNLLKNILPPDDPTPGALTSYVAHLISVGKELAPAFQAISGATQTTQAPQNEVQAELQSLEAQDPTFQSLVNQVNQLGAQKAVFSQDLAQVTAQVGSAINQITTGYATAATLTGQLATISAGLNLQAIQQVQQMAGDARDQLLQYEYYVAKSYEYQMLQPYTGSLQINSLVAAIQKLLASGNDASFLDSAQNYQTLASAYDTDLNLDNILNTAPPQQEQTLAFHLTSQQLQTLNSQGQVTINLVDMGIVPASEVTAATISSIGATKMGGTIDGNPSSADVLLEYAPSAMSIMQSQSQRYFFTFGQQNPISWTTSWDPLPQDAGVPVAGEIAPPYLGLVDVLTGNPVGTASNADELFAHPSVFSDITIAKSGSTDVTLTDTAASPTVFYLQLDYAPESAPQAILDVQADPALSPEIQISQPDSTGRTSGLGSFVRSYPVGQAMVLSAQPAYGQYAFKQWQNGSGSTLGTSPALAITLDQSQQVHAVYADSSATAGIVALTSSAASSAVGMPVLLTAIVQAGLDGVIPSGTVSFADGGVMQGTAALNASGVASLSIASLGAGSHLITATYGGDANYTAGTSNPVPVTVGTFVATATTLHSSASSIVIGEPMKLTAQVSKTSDSGTAPSGTVTFSDSAGIIGSSALLPDGTVTLPATLSSGTHSIVASYSGDALFSSSTSDSIVVSVIAQQTLGAFSGSIQASAFDSESGAQPAPDGGVILSTGDWIGFTSIDFGQGAKQLRTLLRFAGKSRGLRVQLHIDSRTGSTVATVVARGVRPHVQSAKFSHISGIHDLFFDVTGGTGELEISSFMFVALSSHSN